MNVKKAKYILVVPKHCAWAVPRITSRFIHSYLAFNRMSMSYRIMLWRGIKLST